MSQSPPPPLAPLAELDAHLASAGYAVLDAPSVAGLAGVAPEGFARLVPYWETLPPDAHLRDGGRYRRRRHGCFVVEGDRATPTPHRAHWQPVEYNALHGGIERWFEPLVPEMAAAPAFLGLIMGLAARASAIRPGVTRW